MSYILRIKPENEEVKSMYDNHGKFHEGDAGLDLFIAEDITIPGGRPWEAFPIDFKIQCEMYGMIPVQAPKSIIAQVGQQPQIMLQPYSVDYWLMPRSSFGKTPLMFANSMGLIDKGYRGNIIALVKNFSNDDYTITKGTRLFQITTKDAEDFVFKVVGELTETARGTGGFGSTGV